MLAGWTVTEVGRQPWTVYGVMRTADSVSPSLTGQNVLISLIAYGVVYLIIFPVGVALMARLVRIGPLVGHERVDFFQRGRKAGEIERHTIDQRFPVRFR